MSDTSYDENNGWEHQNGNGGNGNGGLGSGPEKLRECVSMFLDLIEDQVAAKAGADDRITTDALQEILDGLRDPHDGQTMTLLKEGYQEIAHLVEEAHWMQERRYPLQRLLVKNFAHLLAERGQAPEQGQNLSRRVLPAFSHALQQMIGPEMLQEYTDRCRNLVQNVRAQLGDQFDWQSVYADKHSHVITNDILVYIARYFTDISKRRHWMIDLFDRSLAPGKGDAERDWVFSDWEFHALVGALYSELFKTLESDDGRDWLNTRYGEGNVAILMEMERALTADRRAVLGA